MMHGTSPRGSTMTRESAGLVTQAPTKVPCQGRLAEAGPALSLTASPMRLSLESSRSLLCDGELPGPFCAEVGRRLLLAQMDFTTWVLRRVESVSFQGDHSVRRTVTVDLRVRDDAP